MRFRNKARLDTSQVRDLRGAGRLPSMRGGKAAVGGGGLIGLIVALVVVLTGGGGLGGLSALDDQTIGAGGGSNQELREECVSGVDANTEADCRIVGVINSVQNYWNAEFERSGLRYEPAQTVFFDGEVETACGVGPLRRGPVLLPRGPHGVHRPRLLLAAAGELRRPGRPVCRGVRDRARVRAPRPEPARRARPDRRGSRRAGELSPFAASSRPIATRAPGPATRRPAASSRS